MKISRDSTAQGEMGVSVLETQTPLKKSAHRISFTGTDIGLQRRTEAQTRVTQGKFGLCGSGERARGTAAIVPVLSPSPMSPTVAISSGSSTPRHRALDWRDPLVPSSGLLMALPCQAPVLLRNQLSTGQPGATAVFLGRLLRRSRQPWGCQKCSGTDLVCGSGVMSIFPPCN